jgi:hypothetical protein
MSAGIVTMIVNKLITFANQKKNWLRRRTLKLPLLNLVGNPLRPLPQRHRLHIATPPPILAAIIIRYPYNL